MAACFQASREFRNSYSVVLRRDENKLQSFTYTIPTTFDYFLELITESSRKQDARFLKMNYTRREAW